MGHAADKIELIRWLSNLEDDETISYLKIVKKFMESRSDWWDDLTDNQKASIQRGLTDIAAGRVTSHSHVKAKYGL